MAHGQCVLVVDRSPDLQEVLQAALSLKGWHVNWLRSSTEQTPATEEHRPGLVVIDADRSSGPQRSSWVDIPQVIISESGVGSTEHAGTREHVRKPFQYRELVRKIERLLTERDA